MLDDFFTRALLAGIGVALVAGPLGCVIVWRRLAYFGDTLSHAALLGVALAFLMQVNIVFSVFAVSVIVAVLLVYLQRSGGLPSDALLGLMSHSALAIGLVVLAFMTQVRFDLTALLIGDILSVSRSDIAIIFAGGCLVLAIFIWNWRELFVATVNEEIAQAEGFNPARANLVFMLLLAIVIAISMKIVGVLLITALLIIPAASARKFASGPEQMMVVSSVVGVAAVIGGLFGSLQWDTPSGPSIVVAALFFFVVSLTPIATLLRGRKGEAS
ncbi:MAG: metal ABC transporter permease [Rhizobiaceae bacterium]|nr:metal ABC transporter permease [Rhizobiaceae bacterium]